MSNSPSTHRPSLVLELPPDRWVYCLACQKPWPCEDAPDGHEALMRQFRTSADGSP